MGLRKKLLTMLFVMYGCAALFSFGELPQEMINDMKQLLRYLGIQESEIAKIQIQEMS